MFLDEKGYRIIEILRRNARTTNSSVASELNLTEGAVRNRIKRLIQSGFIKRFTIDTEPDGAEAVILIKTQAKASKEILRRIRKCSKRLFETAGEYDVAAFLAAENIEKINEAVDKLRAVSGVTSTLTLVKIADDQVSG